MPRDTLLTSTKGHSQSEVPKLLPEHVASGYANGGQHRSTVLKLKSRV